MLLFLIICYHIFVGLPECGNEDLLQVRRHGTHSQGMPQCWGPCLAGLQRYLIHKKIPWNPTFWIIWLPYRFMELNASMYDTRQPSESKGMVCPFLYTAHCSVHLNISVNFTEFIHQVPWNQEGPKFRPRLIPFLGRSLDLKMFSKRICIPCFVNC